jgi:hypothetical protein
VIGYEAAHLALLGRFHQLTVDTYGAQHGGASTPPIATAFGLIGLQLALVDGWTGVQVRDAHRYLAGRFRDWPALSRPAQPGEMTVYGLAAAGSPEAHAEVVQDWAAAVWSGWSAMHGSVAALIDERLPADIRSQLTGSSHPG